MRPAVGEPDVGLPLWVNHPVVAGIAIHCPAVVCLQTIRGDLKNTVKTLQNIHRVIAGSPRRISEREAGAIISIPCSVISGGCPEISPFHLALAGVQHRGSRLVYYPAGACAACCREGHEELGRALQVGDQRVVDWGQLPGGLAQPCRQCAAIKIDTVPRMDSSLSIQGQVWQRRHWPPSPRSAGRPRSGVKLPGPERRHSHKTGRHTWDGGSQSHGTGPG